MSALSSFIRKPGDWTYGSEFVAQVTATLDYEYLAQKPADRTAVEWGTDARLFAAAKAMLAALHDALEFAENQEDVVDGPDSQPQANDAMTLATTLRAAIAKATGSES